MVVERGCVLDHECWILRVKGRNIVLGEAGLWVRPHGAYVPPDKEDPPVCMLRSRGQAGLLTIVYHIHREMTRKSRRTKRQMILKTPWPTSFFSAAASIAFSWSTEKLSAYTSSITGSVCERIVSHRLLFLRPLRS